MEAGPALDHLLDPLPEVAVDRHITRHTAHTVDPSTVVDHTECFTFTTFHQIITMRLDTTLHCICKPTTMVMAGTFTTTWGTITPPPLMLLFHHLHLTGRSLLAFASSLPAFALLLSTKTSMVMERKRNTLKKLLLKRPLWRRHMFKTTVPKATVVKVAQVARLMLWEIRRHYQLMDNNNR